MVVEDDPVLTRVLRDNLTFEGFEVESVADGSLAQAVARDFAPDLVLLDVNLPGQSGFDLCAAWRQRSQVPIILLTAMGQKSDKVRGLQLGADDYVTKPFELEELLARIHAVLRRARTFSSSLTLGDVVVDFAARTATRGSAERLKSSGVPERMMLPEWTIAIRSEIENALFMSWVTTMLVTPSASFRPRMR